MSWDQFPDFTIGFPQGIALADGRIEGFQPLNKFGHTIGMVTGDNVCWDMGGTYNYMNEATGNSLYHSSSSVLDIGKVVTHHLLQFPNWNEVEINATCLGTIPTEILLDGGTIAGTFVRNWRKYNIGTGARFNQWMVGTHYTSMFGTWTAGVPDDLSQVVSVIQPGTKENQSEMAVFSTPGDEKLILTGFYYSILRSAGVTAVGMDVDIVAARPGQPFRSILPLGLSNYGNSPGVFPFPVPQVIGPKTDIELIMDPSTTSDVTGGFFGWRVKI